MFNCYPTEEFVPGIIIYILYYFYLCIREGCACFYTLCINVWFYHFIIAFIYFAFSFLSINLFVNYLKSQ